MELIAKELSNASHPVSDKMQVTTILYSLPLSWEYVVTSWTLSGKDISMTSLPVLLVLVEERMKRRQKEGRATNLLMAQTTSQTSHAPTFKGHLKKFKRKWKGKPKGNFKNKRACYKCGKTRHFKANCPKTNGGKKQNEIAMTITEVMMAEPTTNSWWIDSVATRHITRSREFFVDFTEKAIGEHKVYMGNNTYSDVLGEGKCKISVKGYTIKFKSGKVYISRGNISVKGTKIDHMYFLKVDK
jgi:hypothetical protein